MGISLRKSFKLAPGLRLNVGSGGISWNLGPRGASVTIGRRGSYFNASIPGTGISSRTRLGGPSSRPASFQPSPSVTTLSITAEVTENGEIILRDTSGNSLPPPLAEAALKQNKEAIRTLIERKCDEINQSMEALQQLHWYTPCSDQRPSFTPDDFSQRMPMPPIEQAPGLFHRLIPSKKAKLDQENAQRRETYRREQEAWNFARYEYEQSVAVTKAKFDRAMSGDPEAMYEALQATLEEIVWPRETLIGAEISKDGRVAVIEIDYPEIEDMPNKRAAVPARGFKLNIKDMPISHVRRAYAEHIHAITFRIVGEAFACLPTLDFVLVSGYSQRVQPATGHVGQDYLLSSIIKRDVWSEVNFKALANLDVIAAFDRFETRRSVSATFVVKAIEPFSVNRLKFDMC